MNRVGGEPSLGVLHEVIHFVVILHQFLNPKAARITMRILALIVPATPYPRSRGSSDQRDRLGNDVQTLGSFSGNADLSLRAELDVQSLLHRGGYFLVSSRGSNRG